MADQQDDVCALLNDSGEPALERAIAKAREVVDRLDNVVLNIAVTGATGAGKSTFVNAFRGLKDTDQGAAKTGEVETTTEPEMYPHPNMPNVRIWDLPGIGTKQFKAETYIKDVKFQNYDFFIIIGEKRFREYDIMLANEIKKKKKNFYFVRSMIDQDVKNAARRGKSEEETLQQIRKNCEENLRELGSPPFFLISSAFLEKFEFGKLLNVLERDLPEHKRDALLMSVPVYSKQCLEKKYNTFQKAVWALAVLSGGIAAAPVPGLSTACDVAIVAAFFTKCYHSFGLDDKSLIELGEPHLGEACQTYMRETPSSSNKSSLIKFLVEEWKHPQYRQLLHGKILFITCEETCYKLTKEKSLRQLGLQVVVVQQHGAQPSWRLV
ncbi:interferon-inducible GTPase 5-like [Sardina pilchardus]|uniref:interferon-inducible GTPase 5-like n=1 Tax=Sardina pilchardus TaxID=27697 RepID=UPI002E149468